MKRISVPTGLRVPRPLPSSTNHSLLEGVDNGIAAYGNASVSPIGRQTRFESCYSGNPLVNAFALAGRRDEISYARRPASAIR